MQQTLKIALLLEHHADTIDFISRVKFPEKNLILKSRIPQFSNHISNQFLFITFGLIISNINDISDELSSLVMAGIVFS